MEEVKKPDCIVNYNQHMSGVDLLDQMIALLVYQKDTQMDKESFLLSNGN